MTVGAWNAAVCAGRCGTEAAGAAAVGYDEGEGQIDVDR